MICSTVICYHVVHGHTEEEEYLFNGHPCLDYSDLCPVMALKVTKYIFSRRKGLAIFLIPLGLQLLPLTDSIARKHVPTISKRLNLSIPLIFCDFCRAVVVWVLQHVVVCQGWLFLQKSYSTHVLHCSIFKNQRHCSGADPCNVSGF